MAQEATVDSVLGHMSLPLSLLHTAFEWFGLRSSLVGMHPMLAREDVSPPLLALEGEDLVTHQFPVHY